MMPCVTDLIKANELGKNKMQLSNEPAFPHIVDEKKYIYNEGMSLRDYFAAKAMQGMLSDPKSGSQSIVARYAYEVADAMLEERKK